MLNKNITKPFYFLYCRFGIWLCFFLFLSSNISAQFTVRIKLDAVPYKYKNNAVYMAGSFNSWSPANDNYKFSDNSLTIKLAAGNHEFKFTRGSWDNVECSADGSDIANRLIQINSDTLLTFSISGWKEERKHTASGNVQILSEVFEMPLLHKQRHLWIYLPPGYEKSKTRYPVMYMHDGQNVFDEYYAPFGEWGVDECLDSLITQGKPGCIIVAIENGQMDRMSEYNPFEFTWKGEKDTVTFPPKANEYLNDIIETVKPFIDKRYRTLSSKENTIITGSSMGGLISYYAAIKYPDIFGKAGIFSPAFWTASGIDSLTDASGSNMKGKYFFYMGGKEGGTYIEDMKRIREKVGANSSALIYSVIDPEAEHKEKYWRKWFAEFYNWIMADGYNVNTSSGN
jgi:predicted alpha/beta superfamily hydrolase